MSHPLRVPLHLSGRAKSNSFMYFNMCARACVHYNELAKSLEKIYDLDPRRDSIQDRVEEIAIELVVFAGMCLESTLYDLSACLFGEVFIDHTEKLDPVSKFFVIGRLVDQQAPSTSGVTYQSIQTLVTARNKLVHHKSQSFLDNDFVKLMNRTQRDHEQHVRGVHSSFRALVLLSLYFDGNIFEELRIIPSFSKPEYWKNIVPKELHEEVFWCIKAAKKERSQASASASSTHQAAEVK